MCTVTLIPFRDDGEAAMRIACNRDEARQRPAALPPEARVFGQRRALMPVDPASDGTWIAVNDAGLAMVLLNQNPGTGSRSIVDFRLSRGTIIPSLLHCDNLQSAKRRACRVVTGDLAPFRLLLVDRTESVEVSFVDNRLNIVERPRLGAPMLFTSSGLGDALVESPRRQLFQEWFLAEASQPYGEASELKNLAELQDGFHRHSWPDRQHLSVCMRRADACTVSYTVIELRSRSAGMTYFPQAPDIIGPFFALQVHLQPLEAA
jgi:uncharacterized protein with NRDE domain